VEPAVVHPAKTSVSSPLNGVFLRTAPLLNLQSNTQKI